jgi:transcriptional regulator with XRE-family HTH domain
MPNANKQFGKRLAAFRKEKGYSQQELADMMKTSKTTVTNWETGRFKPTWDKLDMLASIFEIPVSVLVNWEETYNQDGQLADKVKMLEETEEMFGKGAAELLNAFSRLNEKGKTKVINYTTDLCEIEIYRNKEK